MEERTPAKFPYLKKGEGLQRRLRRSASIRGERCEPNSQSTPNGGAPTSLPPLADISPIPREHPINRPITADSGLPGSASPDDFGSVVTDITVIPTPNRQIDFQSSVVSSKAHSPIEHNNFRSSVASSSNIPSQNGPEDFVLNDHESPHPYRRNLSDPSEYIEKSNNFNHSEPSFIENLARRNNVAIPYQRLILPPRVQKLQTPQTPTEADTPMVRPNKRLPVRTPILARIPDKETDQIVNDLAEQLQFLLAQVDYATDVKNHQIDTLKYIYASKIKSVEKKALEQSEKVRLEERNLINAKSKCRLETDKLKEKEQFIKQIQDENIMLKGKIVEHGARNSGLQTTNNKLAKQLKEMESNLKAEREKNERLKSTNDRQMQELTMFRFKAQYSQPRPQISEPSRVPLRPLPRQPFVFRRPTMNRPHSVHEYIVPDSAPLRPTQPPSRKHSSTSSETSVKGVHWASPIEESPEFSENYDPSSLKIYIPEDKPVEKYIDNPEFVEEQYSDARWRQMKACRCECLFWQDGNFQYQCREGVNVDLNYFADDGMITIIVSGYKIHSFASKQLEIHRPNNEKSVVISSGKLYEYFNVEGYQNQAIQTYDKKEWKRIEPDGFTDCLPSESGEKTAVRDEKDYVTFNEMDGTVTFDTPVFKLTKELSMNMKIMLKVKVDASSSRFWQVNICPSDRNYRIKHALDSKNKKACVFSENTCDHFRN